MPSRSSFISLAKTTAGRQRAGALLLLAVSISLAACGAWQTAGTRSPKEEAEEAVARTEFTERVENFFEYEPLKAAKPSQFRIHLTDLRDGSPVEQAEVTLTVRAKGGAQAVQTKARVGKVTGIYVADLMIPQRGDYDIEFHIKNTRLDERLPLADFKVE
ncbi:MAG: FixH family protein [Blastocatellales bacterium]